MKTRVTKTAVTYQVKDVRKSKKKTYNTKKKATKAAGIKRQTKPRKKGK